MFVFSAIVRTGIFAEGRFLGKVLDAWIGDAQEFVHTKLPHLIVVIGIAIVITRLIALAARRIATMAERKDARPGRHNQVKTFSGIFRTTLIAILWTLTTLQILAVLGFNLGPLLASAGIAGVAIGLAAQTIVKDILNGMLIVLEDQFNVGETVRLTGMTGTVESMSLRRTELRDFDGTLYMVPNSQITTVANLSRDFSVATVNVSVDFSAPPDKVIALLKSVAADIRNDASFADVFLQDPDVVGVDAINGSQVIYPVVFKTQAGKQYGVIRAFRSQVRIALEKNAMLPGDPNRVFRDFTSPDSQKQLTEPIEEDPKTPHEHPQKKTIDPTTIPAAEHNPFISE